MRKKFTFLAIYSFLAFSLRSVAQQHQALNLNGTNYVATVSTNVVPSSGDFTIEFWAYINASAMDQQVHQFVSEGAGDGLTGFRIGFDGTDSTILVNDHWNAPRGNAITTGIKMPVNQWTHIAVTYNSSIGFARLYLNGVIRTSNSTFFNSGMAFRIGTSTTLAQFAVGKIDDLKAWNAERSAFSVQRDMFNDPDSTDPTLQVWYKLDDNGTLAVPNLATTSGSSQDGTIAGDGPGPAAPNSWTWSPIQSSSNGLTFMGAENDQVIIPDVLAYDTLFNGADNKDGTIELWVNPTALSGSWTTLVSKYGQYSILLDSLQIGIDNGTGVVNTLTLPTSGDFINGFPAGPDVWSHLAFIYDALNNNTRVYYNGFILDNIPGTLGAASTGQPLTIGITMDNTGAVTRPFTGGIDEVRLWSIQQSDPDIFNNMNNTLSGTEPNLVSQFTFDQGVPAMDNTGLTVAFDHVAGNHGTLKNFQLTGTASNFNLHTLNTIPVPLPVTFTGFTAQRSGPEGLLQWQTAQEENSKEFTVERSPDGKTYDSIGVVPAAGISSKPRDYSFADGSPIKGPNYYRLRQSDLDNKYTYSPVRSLYFGESTSDQSTRLIEYNTGRLSAEVVLPQGTNENYILSDISGRKLRQGQLSNGKTAISHLPAGIYIIGVRTRIGETLTTKIFLY